MSQQITFHVAAKRLSSINLNHGQITILIFRFQYVLQICCLFDPLWYESVVSFCRLEWNVFNAACCQVADHQAVRWNHWHWSWTNVWTYSVVGLLIQVFQSWSVSIKFLSNSVAASASELGVTSGSGGASVLSAVIGQLNHCIADAADRTPHLTSQTWRVQAPVAEVMMSAPASQAYVERIITLWGILTNHWPQKPDETILRDAYIS